MLEARYLSQIFLSNFAPSSSFLPAPCVICAGQAPGGAGEAVPGGAGGAQACIQHHGGHEGGYAGAWVLFLFSTYMQGILLSLPAAAGKEAMLFMCRPLLLLSFSHSPCSLSLSPLFPHLQGKIRVFCRVRPILPFETDKGQSFGLNIPDELTITHLWKDEKKPREYNFDQVSRLMAWLQHGCDMSCLLP